MQLAGERLALAATDEQRADDRGEHADGGDEEREEVGGLEQRALDDLDDVAGDAGGEATEEQCSEDDRGDDRAGVRLEEVGAHAGDVTDVVTDVVGDRGGVAGVVLRDAGLDLADEVRADVSGLGVDAATDAGEQGDGGGTETERRDDGERVGHGHDVDEQDVGEADPQQPEACDREAHDRAALEGERQRSGGALAGGVGGADVRGGRDAHADDTGDRGEHRAHQVGDGAPRCAVRQHHGDHDHHDEDEHRHPAVLPLEEGGRALADGLRELAHDLGALVGAVDHHREVGGQHEAGDGRCYGQVGNGTHGCSCCLGAGGRHGQADRWRGASVGETSRYVGMRSARSGPGVRDSHWIEGSTPACERGHNDKECPLAPEATAMPRRPPKKDWCRTPAGRIRRALGADLVRCPHSCRGQPRS